jgi:hypothetical protein
MSKARPNELPLPEDNINSILTPEFARGESGMENQLMWIIACFGAIALVGIFFKMERGFGPFNLRAVAITLVAVLASLLSLREGPAMTAGMGILGAIAGYVFGIKDRP